jgi:hypothetical protein
MNTPLNKLKRNELLKLCRSRDLHNYSRLPKKDLIRLLSAESHEPPAVESHEPPAESHEPPAESHEPPAAESHEPPAESHEPPAAESHEPPAESHEPPAESHEPPAVESHEPHVKPCLSSIVSTILRHYYVYPILSTVLLNSWHKRVAHIKIETTNIIV